MNPSYFLYLIAFLAFPLMGHYLSKQIDLEKNKKYVIVIALFFLLHNILFLVSYSLKGDYADYVIFSLEYFFFCFVIFLLYQFSSIIPKVIRSIGMAFIVIGYIQGFFGVFLFIVVSQDYEADKVYNFQTNKHHYQTRRYSFGFATLDDTKYILQTYKRFLYLPFEKQINTTTLLGFKTKLDFYDKNFKVMIDETKGKRKLIFSSSNEASHSIEVD